MRVVGGGGRGWAGGLHGEICGGRDLSHHSIPEEVVPVLAGHDAGDEGEGGKRSVKVGATEVDPLAGAEVREDEGTDEGVGEEDEKEDAHKRDGAQQSAHHSDGQVLHDALHTDMPGGYGYWVYRIMDV